MLELSHSSPDISRFLAAKQALHPVISLTDSLTDWLTVRQLALLGIWDILEIIEISKLLEIFNI